MPPEQWDWSRLPEQARQQRWDALAAWVPWLEEHYSPWVKLPPCWPRHEGLRRELEFFRAWHVALMTDGDAVEGVNWHASLRAAAAAWMAVAHCSHSDTPGRRTVRTDVGSFERHLEVAMGNAESTGRPAPPPTVGRR